MNETEVKMRNSQRRVDSPRVARMLRECEGPRSTEFASGLHVADQPSGTESTGRRGRPGDARRALIRAAVIVSTAIIALLATMHDAQVAPETVAGAQHLTEAGRVPPSAPDTADAKAR
jgi:hypothetical protein